MNKGVKVIIIIKHILICLSNSYSRFTLSNCDID